MSGAIAAYVAVGALAVNAYSSYQGAKEQKKARQAAERQYVAETKRAEVQNVRSIREQVRATRLAQGQMSNVGAQTGGMGGSALAGGLSSLQSQQAGNINFMSDIAEQNTAIGQAGLDVARAQSRAAVWGAVGQLASQVGSTALQTGGMMGRGPAPKAGAK